ncbi:MAG: NAD-dependent epimerase/dehydratase family protein [Nitrospirota bacterium]
MNAFVSGGAGFIGSHLVARLLSLESCAQVTIYDNFSSGKMWHLGNLVGHPAMTVVNADIKDLAKLTEAMTGSDVVFHLASNPDISKAITRPDIDFWEGTYLTQNILEAMRVNGIKRLLYTSGSGVYGEVGSVPVAEDYGPLLPISTYAASKLAGEALICSYCHMFDMHARAFRFANVVGPRQTHGVVYDFIRRLRQDPTLLRILGDGSQSKSYIHVDDVLDAVFLQNLHSTGTAYDCFNIATDDYITVRDIADLVVREMGFAPDQVRYEFTGGDRGWKGDVPIVRFDLAKIHRLGWHARYSSREALRRAINAQLQEPA